MSRRALSHGGLLFTRQVSPLFELALVLVRLDHVACCIVNANYKMMRATESLPFTRQFELAALLLSGRAVLDRLFRGLVNFLWCDQYRCSGLHGAAGVDGQREGC